MTETTSIEAGEAGFHALLDRVSHRFGRKVLAKRALTYLHGILGRVERKH